MCSQKYCIESSKIEMDIFLQIQQTTDLNESKNQFALHFLL